MGTASERGFAADCAARLVSGSGFSGRIHATTISATSLECSSAIVLSRPRVERASPLTQAKGVRHTVHEHHSSARLPAQRLLALRSL